MTRLQREQKPSERGLKKGKHEQRGVPHFIEKKKHQVIMGL